MNPETVNTLLFLGPIGGPEIIMILVILLLLAVPVVVIVVLVVVLSNRKPPQLPMHPGTPPQLPEAESESKAKDL